MNQFLPFYNDECSMQHKELFDHLLSQARAQEVARGTWDARYEERLNREADLIRQHGGIDLLLTLHALCNPAAAPKAITTNAAPTQDGGVRHTLCRPHPSATDSTASLHRQPIILPA